MKKQKTEESSALIDLRLALYKLTHEMVHTKKKQCNKQQFN